MLHINESINKPSDYVSACEVLKKETICFIL